MNAFSVLSGKLKRIMPAAVIGGLAAYLLNASWMKWGNILVDTYRDPYVVWRMVEDGLVLYRDIAYEYGFFAPYFLAGIARVFGTGIATFVGVSIFFLGLIGILQYRISRFFLSGTLSVIAVMLFFSIAAVCERFPYDMGGAVLPYSFATLIWVAFLLASVYLILRMSKKNSWSDLTFLGLCLTCGFLTRPWLQVSSFAGFVAVMFICFVDQKRRRGLITMAVAFVAALTVYALFFAFTGTWTPARRMLVDRVLQVGVPFEHYLFWGANDPAGSLRNILLSVIATFVVLAVVAAFLRAGERADPSKRRAFTVVVPVIGLSVAWGVWGQGNMFTQLMVVAVVLPLSLLWYGRTVVRSGAVTGGTAAMIVLYSGAMFSAFRFWGGLNPYVCYPLLLALVIPSYVVFLRVTIPEFVPWLRGANSPAYEKALTVLLVSSILFWTHATTVRYSYKTGHVVNPTTGEGFFYYPSPSWDGFAQTFIQYSRASLPSNATIAVLPEGIGLNYFLRLRSSLRFYHINPAMFSTVGANAIMDDFAVHGPDYILVAQRECSLEFKQDFWQQPCAKTLMGWISENYERVESFGQVPFQSNARLHGTFYPHMGAVLYKRKIAEPGVS